MNAHKRLASAFVASAFDLPAGRAEVAGLGFALTWRSNFLNRYPIVDAPVGIVEDQTPAGLQMVRQTFTDRQLSVRVQLVTPVAAALHRRRFPTFA